MKSLHVQISIFFFFIFLAFIFISRKKKVDKVDKTCFDKHGPKEL